MKHLLQQCLEALESIPDFMFFSGGEKIEPAIKAIKESLAKDEQALDERLRAAPVALMDTRTALSICALREEDFPALYALQGKRVRIVVDDDRIVNPPKDEQAPVAWGIQNTAITGKSHALMVVRLEIPSDDQYAGKLWIPLYTRPAQRQPLSEEEIDELIDITIAEQGHMHDWDMYKFASVIENSVYEKLGIR